MHVLKQINAKKILIAFGVLAAAVLYLVLAYYNELRALFAERAPKVLVASANQCLPDTVSNPSKIMFVSCSGFYDEE